MQRFRALATVFSHSLGWRKETATAFGRWDDLYLFSRCQCCEKTVVRGIRSLRRMTRSRSYREDENLTAVEDESFSGELGQSSDSSDSRLGDAKTVSPSKSLSYHSFSQNSSQRVQKRSARSAEDSNGLSFDASSDIKSQLRNAVSSPELTSEAEFPSDIAEVRRLHKRDQTRHAYRPKIDPEDTSIVLFPGQGSQFVGMGSKLLDYPNVVKMYELASRILGYDLLEICLHGPKEVLNKTIYCQPAVVVTSLAAIEKLKYSNPAAIENCISAAGYSVGEYAALVFTGAISFEDAVHLVKVRAKAMQAASEMIPSGMMTVIFGADGKIKFACHAAKLYCKQELGMDDAVCEITNYLYPGCKVIAGNQEALKFIEQNAKEFGIRRTQYLPVSGAFHSRLMHYATASMARSLASVQINHPAVPVHSNVTSCRYRSTTAISKLLVEQIWKPVKWEQTMHVLYGRRSGGTFPQTFEVGPGRQMGAILRQINAKAFEQYHNVEV